MDYRAAKDFIIDKLKRELSADLTYHGLHHTLDVFDITKELCNIEAVTTQLSGEVRVHLCAVVGEHQESAPGVNFLDDTFEFDQIV